MKFKWLLLAGVVVLSNGAILAGAAYNRWAPPVQQLTLTERELSLPYWASRGDAENSQLSLAINWQVAQDEVPEWNYGRVLTVASDTFRALQLQPVNCPGEKRRVTQKTKGWVALEFNGPAYQQRLAQLEQRLAALQDAQDERGINAQKRYQQQLARARISDSRLYAVAVARDLAELKAQLQGSAQAYWLVPAELSAAGQCADQQVNISRLLISALHLANDQRYPLMGLGQRAGYREQPAPPRYTVEVAVGRRYEPWVVSVAGCAQADCVGENAF